MLNLLLLIAGALTVGFIEWWLALRRTLAVIAGNIPWVLGTVFVENYLGFWVSRYVIREDNLLVANLVYVAYCCGAVVGSLIPLLNRDKESSSD